MAARKQKQRRMSAQVAVDEDYQLRYEVAAGVDVAKDSAVVCVRMPPAEGRKHRTSHLQTVPATVPAITRSAGEQRISRDFRAGPPGGMPATRRTRKLAHQD